MHAHARPRARAIRLNCSGQLLAPLFPSPLLLANAAGTERQVDMWSVGCIIAEVLGAQAIFPGKDSLHQLRLVIELLGMPSDDELSFVQKEEAAAYIRTLRPARSVLPLERFSQLFPCAEPSLLDLLGRFLQFDPRKRLSAAEALMHPFLEPYRQAPEENLPTPEIEMNFDCGETHTDELRELVWDEVLRYHPELPTSGRGRSFQQHTA